MNNDSGFNNIENLSNIYNSTISLKKASLHPKSKPPESITKMLHNIDSIEKNTRRTEPVASAITLNVSGHKNKIKNIHADIIQPISLNINSSELSESEKELFLQLLQDIKNSKISNTEKKSKVMDFLSEISKGTISGALGAIISEFILNPPTSLIP